MIRKPTTASLIIVCWSVALVTGCAEREPPEPVYMLVQFSDSFEVGDALTIHGVGAIQVERAQFEAVKDPLDHERVFEYFGRRLTKSAEPGDFATLAHFEKDADDDEQAADAQ